MLQKPCTLQEKGAAIGEYGGKKTAFRHAETKTNTSGLRVEIFGHCDYLGHIAPKNINTSFHMQHQRLNVEKE